MAADGPPAVFLMGPTATGKTRLAVELVKKLPCEIISVDSAMVYRGMDIGTAKPDRGTQEQAPHRLIDILDPSCRYSAARFREDALREMAAVTSAGRIPLLVGGTMLYFRALEHGLTQLPAANAKVRARLEEEAKSIGWAALHKRLARIDPVAAERIHRRDPQRVQRALEVYELTGLPLTEHYRCGRAEILPYNLIKFALIPVGREHLRDRIAKRFQKMLEQGLIIEVEALYKRGDLEADMPSIRAVGYRQVWDYLQGRLDYESMTYKAVVATRQLAKRQLTWLRSIQDSQRIVAEQCSPASVVRKICTHLGPSYC